MYSNGNSNNPVIVMELPERLNQAEGQKFLSEMQPLFETDRPRIVLDCSRVQNMDSAGIEMLLHCLGETMKRNGDMKLAAVSPAAATILELMRADRLFEVFESPEEASRSFHAVASSEGPQSLPWYSAAYGLADLKSAS